MASASARPTRTHSALTSSSRRLEGILPHEGFVTFCSTRAYLEWDLLAPPRRRRRFPGRDTSMLTSQSMGRHAVKGLRRFPASRACAALLALLVFPACAMSAEEGR